MKVTAGNTLFFIALSLMCYSQALECISGTEPKSRTYSTMTEYEENTIPFDPSNGNIVKFSFTSIDVIPKNTFLTHDSQHLIALDLKGKQIITVDEGAFISLKCLQELTLKTNKIQKLSRDVFQDLNNLKKLDLSENNLTTIKDLVFSDMPQLVVLNLNHNQIRSLERLAFQNLSKLEYLNLEGNRIRSLLPDIFEPLNSVKRLILASNLLYGVKPEEWTGLKKLQNLNLARNSLDHFDPSYKLTFNGLKTLNLSSNFLSQLNTLFLKKNLPLLERLDLDGNPWSCSDLLMIIHDLVDSKIEVSGRNVSHQNEQGIACNDWKGPPYKPTSEPSTTVVVSTQKPNIETKLNLERIMRENEEIKNSQIELTTTVHHMENLMFWAFACIVVFSICAMVYRAECLSYITNRMRRRVNRSDVERAHLIY